MKIAICDDEQIYIDNIVKHLDIFSAENNIDFEKSIFTDSSDILSCDIKFDIAVLDIEMDNMNGIKLGEELRKRNPHIILIYVTAHRKYLDDALNLNAVRFFEKPLDSQRFYRGLSDAINSEEKQIELSLRHINNMDMLNVVNSCDIVPKHKNNQLLTTKFDTGSHGFGTKIIKKYVKKNNGKYEWSEDDIEHKFHVTILFQKDKRSGTD